jgi:hypothetical protein
VPNLWSSVVKEPVPPHDRVVDDSDVGLSGSMFRAGHNGVLWKTLRLVHRVAKVFGVGDDVLVKKELGITADIEVISRRDHLRMHPDED